MAIYKTRGIVLKRKNFFEADRMITILAKHYGKLRILAKGVRKSLSKNSGSIELFVISDFLFAEGRSFDILASAKIFKSFKNIRNDLSKTALLYKIAELVDKTVEEKQEHDNIYDLTKKVLEYLDRVNLKKDNLVFEYFAFNLLSQVGFSPQLKKCVNCDKLLKKKNHAFSPSYGGILCQECAKSDKIVLLVNPNEIKILRLFLEKNISLLDKIRFNNSNIKTIKKVISNFIDYIIEKELKSSKFLEKVNRMG